jgi:hypothetical protein
LSKWQEKCHFTKVQETTPDFEGGKRYATCTTGSTTSPTGIQQQANETDLQLEGHLPQESHLLSDIPTPEAGPEPAHQPQSMPDITNEANELVEGAVVRRSMRQRRVPQRLIEIFEAEIMSSNNLYEAYELLAQPDDIEPESDYEHPA